MNGLKYYRTMQGCTKRELAEKAGVSQRIVQLCENENYLCNTKALTYLRMSDALGVPVDELLRCDLPDIPVKNEHYGIRSSNTANPQSPITRYREVHKLSFLDLAHRLGCNTKESGRVACAQKNPSERYIKALANYEGISPEDFLAIYTPKQPTKKDAAQMLEHPNGEQK